MKKRTEGRGGYVREVQERTQKYVSDLLKENERLRTLFVSIEREKQELEQNLAALRLEVDRRRDEYGRLQSEFTAITAQHERHTEEYVMVEEQNANLANLYVASYRLHGTVDRAEVLSAIQEIVVNLIGSEEHAIFGVGPDGKSLSLLASFGLDRARFESIPFDKGIIGHAAATGERYVAIDAQPSPQATHDEEHLTVCIPLHLGDEVVGAIAIFRLLPQKAELEASDHELIELLATHAATALSFTELYAKRRPGKHA
jgi:GAF domain-containing protein